MHIMSFMDAPLPPNCRARVRVGEHTLSKPLDCWDLAKNGCAPKPQDFVPTKIIPHESYNAPNPFQHDIALLKLDRPVVRNGTSVSRQDFYRARLKGGPQVV